jgi:tetratricopeptide (TPR) repeat protein
VLEKALANGQVKGDADTWRLLASSHVQARDYDEAIPAFEKASALSEDGKTDLELAQIYLQEERWDDARRALAAAIRKGKLDDPGRAQLLLGIANANRGRYAEAKEAFRAAGSDAKTEKSAAQWLAHIEKQR